VKVREVVKRLEKEGWYQMPGKRTNHHFFKHPSKAGKIVVPGNPGDEISKGTLGNIKQTAGW
jgi:predicted RNA binding protein YcfA (HicA-like mRNA interferase family)